jgi:hypothetical protein
MIASRRIWALSLVLHLALALLFLLPWQRPASRPPEAVMVELPLPEPATPSLLSGKPSGRAGHASPPDSRVPRASAQPAPSALPFSALAPAKTYLSPLAPAQARPSPGHFDSPFAASESWGESGSRAESGALGWIFRKAQNEIGYPAEFKKHDIYGEVAAHLVFSEAGDFLLPELEVRSPSPYLRVYVYRLLEHTFRTEPVPVELRKWKDKLRVDCYVRFTFTESGAAVTVDLPDSVVGHRIYLSRKFVKSKLAWDLGPLHGVFPVPAVGIDMLWFARQAKEAVKPSIPVDDLAPYREDPLFRAGL